MLQAKIWPLTVFVSFLISAAYPLKINLLFFFCLITHVFTILINIKCYGFTVILLSQNNSTQ